MKTKARNLSLAMTLLVAGSAHANHVFINEIHYENQNTDAGEAVEISGPAGADLTGWSVVLYNGSNGLSYDTVALSGALGDQNNGFGLLMVTFSDPIQNGPDGIALIDAAGAVMQFLSYEGEFKALNGPAFGLKSTDIGVSESGSTPAGHSLQLTGSGRVYDDFVWSAPSVATFGAINTGQTFLAPLAASMASATSTTVPEPGTLALAGLGLAALRRRPAATTA